MEKQFIAYYRVSTTEQGNSGLGLDAQKASVSSYINSVGTLVSEYKDIESGASQTRLGMEQAIKACRESGATLVVKELSRITRSGFKYRQMLEDYGIPFIEAGSPNDSEVVQDIKFSLAKDELKKIRQRTTDALAQIKGKLERGEVHVSKAGNVVTALGSPQNLSDISRARSIEIRSKKALEDTNNVRAGELIKALYPTMNFKQVTVRLNESGFRTSRGNLFSEVATKRMWLRYKD